jgi:hypothetical protein
MPVPALDPRQKAEQISAVFRARQVKCTIARESACGPSWCTWTLLLRLAPVTFMWSEFLDLSAVWLLGGLTRCR